MSREALIETFCSLVRTRSCTGEEAALARQVSEYLCGLGLEVQSDCAQEAATCPAECGNLFTLLPATGEGYPTLLVNAHLDTVIHEGGVEPVVEGEVIRSGGDTILGADDKAGVALILLALRRLVEEKLPHGNLWAVFTVAEETGLWGAKHMDLGRLDPWPEAGYVLDGGRQAGKMTTSAPSSVSLDATLTGRAAHAGVCPEQGISAVQAAARALAGMKLGRLDEETTANVGVIRGGTARNIVPEKCTLQGEARSHSEEKLTAQIAHMRGRLEEAAQETGARLEVQVERSYNCFALPDEHPAVRRAAEAARRVGLEPVTERGGGGSDANIFNERGIPSLIMATGALGVHTPEEQLDLGVALRCLDWLVEIVTAPEQGGQAD